LIGVKALVVEWREEYRLKPSQRQILCYLLHPEFESGVQQEQQFVLELRAAERWLEREVEQRADCLVMRRV
jgi:hypothetical protein